MRVRSTIAMISRHQMISLMPLLVAMLSGCASEKAETEVPAPPVVIEKPKEPESMSLLLACAPSNSNSSLTRLADEVVQLNDYYRKITNFRFVALKDEVVSDCSVDNPSDSINHYSENQNISDFRYYHSHYCNMVNGVNGCLVYAKADNSNKSDTKVYNGSLKAVIPESYNLTATSDIYFEPVSIYSDVTVGADGIPEDAWKLANALTEIASVDYEEIKWSTLNEKNLKSLYAHFTNNGYDLAGSAASVRKWIEAVKAAAERWSFGDGTPQEGIRRNIIAKATDLLDETKAGNVVSLNYPQNINLPDGAAVLRWADVEEGEGESVHTVKKFVPQLHTTTLDDINSVSRFVYPPALYYFVDSDIWTSNKKVEYTDYKDRSSWKGNDNTWNGEDDGTVQWLFSDGGIVMSNTKTIAIASPLQYAVAQLSLMVQVADGAAYATSLPYDGDNHRVAYTNGDDSYFRLTGVIIGGQRTVGYNFKPVNNSDMDVKFVYDSQVKDDVYDSQLKNGFWLKQSSTDVFNTLVLQSYDDEDLNVILEFEYTGEDEFKCLNGYVYPGTRFYLVGEVKLSTGTPSPGVAEEDKEDVRKRVFTQDRITSIQMTVSSLENAYNVLPNIIAKNLEIGVQTTPQWKAAEPSDPVIME